MYEKVIVVSDLHAHLCNFDHLNHLVETHAHDTDILVLGGDIFDGYGISRFLKHDYVPLLDEYDAVIEILDYLCDNFKRIVVIGGNHDFRWERTVVSQAPIEARAFIGEPFLKRACRRDEFIKGEWVIGEGYKNIELMTYNNSIAWFWHYKGILVAHAEKYSQTPGKIGQATAEFFRKKMGIEPKVVINNHTHRLFMLYYPHMIYVESGCMCKEADYADMNPALKYSEQVNGYVVVVLKDDEVMPQYTYIECLQELK